jgi:hypothetical protein
LHPSFGRCVRGVAGCTLKSPDPAIANGRLIALSVAFSLTAYGHLLDSDLDDLARRLDLNGVRDIRGIALMGESGADA